jgi:hypothetical protein
MKPASHPSHTLYTQGGGRQTKIGRFFGDRGEGKAGREGENWRVGALLFWDWRGKPVDGRLAIRLAIGVPRR